MLRKAQLNPNMRLDLKMTILWRPELAHIQELNDMPKYASMSKANVSAKIRERVPLDVLQKQISDELFERDYNTIADRINAYREAHGQKKRRKGGRKKRKYRIPKNL